MGIPQPFQKQLPSFLWASISPFHQPRRVGLGLSFFSENGANNLYLDSWVVESLRESRGLKVAEQWAPETLGSSGQEQFWAVKRHGVEGSVWSL